MAETRRGGDASDARIDARSPVDSIVVSAPTFLSYGVSRHDEELLLRQLRTGTIIAISGEDYRGAKLNIYDAAGRRVFHSVCGRIPWLGVWTDNDGAGARPGVYVLQVKGRERVLRTEPVLVRE